MNKKKFLATCTLVAFGSTMLPAFAFAAAGSATADADWVVGATEVTVNADAADTWFGGGDTVKIVKIADNGEQTAVENTATIANAGSSGDAGIATITLADPLAVGKYLVTVTNTNTAAGVAPDTSQANADATVNTKVLVTVEAVDQGSTASVWQVTSGKIVDATGKVFNPASDTATLGMVKFVDERGSAVSSSTYLYPIAGPDSLLTAGATSTLQPASSTGYVAASDLRVGWYGVGTASPVVATTPTLVVEYTQAEADKVAAVNTALKDQLTTKADLIGDSLVITTADGKGDILAKIAAADTTKTLKAGDMAIANVKGNLSAYTTASAFANGVFSTIGTGAVDTLGVASVSGVVTVAVTYDPGIANVYATKDVNVTVNTVGDVTFPAAVDAYGTASFADYNKGTNAATTTFSKVGEGFDLASEVVSVASAVETKDTMVVTTATSKDVSDFELAQYFDKATGKVIALPEKDITMTAVLNLKTTGNQSGSATTITVTTTIKAATGTGDIEELEKALAEATTAVTAKIEELNKVEGKLTVAQLNELYQAYKPYKEAKAALAAAQGK